MKRRIRKGIEEGLRRILVALLRAGLKRGLPSQEENHKNDEPESNPAVSSLLHTILLNKKAGRL
jgi:hypothetical protein